MSTTAQQDTTLIKLRSVTKNYRVGRGKFVALQDINLSVSQGELLIIVGPSGSGKTTLTHVIGGLIKPNEGEVLLQGKKLAYKSDKAMSSYRNKTIGFVFQNYSLLPHYTALENVMMPLIVAGVAPRKRKLIAKKYLTMVGLEKQMNQRSSQLSGGQRQRVGIARALTMEPKIIIADEPTGNLDTIHGNEIVDMLQTLTRKAGVAVIMVTHNDALAKRADQLVHIVDGKITEIQHASA